MKLLVVESTTKAKKIQPMLGSDWVVVGSVGHIRDLPKAELGVSLDTFQPQYVVDPGKKDVIAKLRSAVRQVGNDNVYLGTDPDREGEAIAAALEEVLGLRNPKRVTFNDVKESAIRSSVKAPRQIDRKLVAAQEARRVLDRLEGYGVSGDLRAKTGGMNWTAGRVQSPGLRLVVEREEEIRNHVSVTHYGVRLTFDQLSSPWRADWYFVPLLPESEKEGKIWLDRAFAERVATVRDVRVLRRHDDEAKTSPPPAFTTVTMLKAGSATLKFDTKLTTDLAQSLHNKGYISYHRTDNPNLSVESAREVQAHARSLGLAVAPDVRMIKTPANAQLAHNAICPTHLEIRDGRSTGELTADEAALYELIWKRAVASQLADARYDRRMVALEAVEKIDGKQIIFNATGRVLKFRGYLDLTSEDASVDRDDSEEPSSNPIPDIAQGQQLRADRGVAIEKLTEPPARYTKATLLETLEKRNIGRPSTFSSIVQTILSRGYVEERKGEKKSKTLYLFPTESGEAVMSLVRGRFAVADFGYTAELEERFDDIAAGKATFYDVVHRGYRKYLDDKKQFASMNVAGLPGVATGGPCPKCHSGNLIRKQIRPKPGAGDRPCAFWGCSGFADGSCDARFRDANGKPDLSERAPDVLGPTCPTCNSERLVRRETDGRAWWGCKGFKNGCAAKFRDKDGSPDLDYVPPADSGPCPACKTGRLYLRKRADGRGQFFSCSGFRTTGKGHCEAIFDDDGGKPKTDGLKMCPAPKCKWGVLRRRDGSKGPFWGCSNRACNTIVNDVDGEPDPDWKPDLSTGRGGSGSPKRASGGKGRAKRAMR